MTDYSEPPKPFNGNGYANFLIVAGIVGLIYTLFFSSFYGNPDRQSENHFVDFTLTPFWKEHVKGIINYYIFNSFLCVFAGIALKANKRMGFYGLIALGVSVLASLAVWGDNTSLFAFTFQQSTEGMLLLAPLAVCTFLAAIITNLVVIKKWWLVTTPVK